MQQGFRRRLIFEGHEGDDAFRAEERKRKLREAAAETERTGQDQPAFEDSAYSLPEDSRTPNIHSRQGEGAKTINS